MIDSAKPYTRKEMQDLVEWLEKHQIVPLYYGDRLMATAAAAESDIPDYIADVVRSAFIAGLDKAREVRESYGEWPSLPGRVELADDYVSVLVLFGPEEQEASRGNG